MNLHTFVTSWPLLIISPDETIARERQSVRGLHSLRRRALMRDASVVGFIPSRAAAPSAP